MDNYMDGKNILKKYMSIRKNEFISCGNKEDFLIILSTILFVIFK